MPGTDIQKWADKSMFVAEKSDAAAGPVAYLLGGPVDPLGQIAACAKMYKGEVVRDLADVSDAERREYLEQIQKTALKMPLEAVSLHFMLEGVHRGITHQMVRQRTAAYAQESTRFAVKADLTDATALPPSLHDTLPMDEYIAEMLKRWEQLGLTHDHYSLEELEGAAYDDADDLQTQRFQWDKAVGVIGEAYLRLIDEGMPAEEARGLMPTNITTRLNYITNLRSFYETMGVRVSDQAQFEWRQVARAYAIALRTYGDEHVYPVWVDDITREDEDRAALYYAANHEWEERVVDGRTQYLVERSSGWQYVALTNEIKPIEFRIGGPAFGANFDRPSRIGERVRAFAACGVPSSLWTAGSLDHSIPAIHPEEWLLDPDSARLKPGQEFDVYGRRVPEGKGEHWIEGRIFRADGSSYRWLP